MSKLSESRMKTERIIEKKRLKSKIEAVLSELGVSKRVFKRTLPKMKGKGYKYFPDVRGGKASLRQQYQFLIDLKESLDQKKIKVEYKENENAE